MRFPFVSMTVTVAFLAACGGSTSKDDAVTDPGAEVAQDAEVMEVATEIPGEVPPEAVEEIAPEVPVEEVVTPPVPFGQENRGYKMLRGIVHLHSNWSHDGCYPQHEEIDPSLLVDCETEHRRAPCQAGIDFVMQTDHPGDVSDATFEQALHYRPEAGDQLLNGSNGRLTANKVTCPDGSLVPSFLYFVGTEGSKNMPIGLSAPVPADLWRVSYDDATPIADAQAAIAKVHEMGGYAFVCHPEQGDLSVETIKALPLDGIELFNFHPMLMAALGDGFDQFLRVDSFMNAGTTNPVPDLAILLLMAPIANDPLKFDASTPYIRLTGFGATDIHRNVEVPPLCPSFEECGDYTYDYPNFAHLLADGGPVMLADGDRMDSFVRSFRWMSNHTLVAADKPQDVDEVRQAIGLGRSFMAFDMMGMPKGFDFFAVADGNPVEMGKEIAGTTAVKMYLRAPTLAKTPWTLPDYPAWTEGQSGATMRTKVLKATTAGVQTVLDETGEGRTFEIAVDGPGAYRVEVWVTPRHLRAGLKGVEDLAEKEVPYLYSNAIMVR